MSLDRLGQGAVLNLPQGIGHARFQSGGFLQRGPVAGQMPAHVLGLGAGRGQTGQNGRGQLGFAHFGKLLRHIQRRLAGVAFQRGVKLSRRAVFQRPQGQVQSIVGFRLPQGFFGTVVAQLFQRQITDQQGRLVVRMLVQRFLRIGQRVAVHASAQLNQRGAGHGPGACVLSPRGLQIAVQRFVLPAQRFLDAGHHVLQLAAFRMEVAHRGYLPGVKRQLPGAFGPEVSQLVVGQRNQGRQVIRIPAQGFPPVTGGTDGRIPVLLGVHAQQIQLLRALELIHGGIVRDGLRHFLQLVCHGLFIAEQRPALLIQQTERSDLLR